MALLTVTNRVDCFIYSNALDNIDRFSVLIIPFHLKNFKIMIWSISFYSWRFLNVNQTSFVLDIALMFVTVYLSSSLMF